MRASSSSPTHALALQADKVMLAAVTGYGLVALAIGQYYGAFGLALGSAALLTAVAAAAYMLARGTMFSRLVLASCAMSLVALHIQLGRGTVEFHFGVFVTLALLLFYRDWRPILLAAGVIAVHHLLFDRLQAAGWSVYCTPDPNFLKIMCHAAYVVVQAGVEILIVVRLYKAERQGEELGRIVQELQCDNRIALNVRDVSVSTEGAAQLKEILLRLHDSMQGVTASVCGMRQESSSMASGNQELNERTQQAAASIQKISCALVQLTESVNQSTQAASNASELAGNAADVAAKGGAVVSQVVALMGEIHNSSRKIADITGVIDSIAFQTNILALNAAVEAARAGDHGRGFAVVASEVRNLAQRAGEAAKQIRQLIGESVEKVESGSQLVQDAGSTMGEIVASAKRVTTSVGEISAVATSQSKGIVEVNEGLGDLDRMTQQNATLVRESAASAARLKEQATALASFQMEGV
ncbi:MAG TPA: methyl-accepting chemotaxis protein [Burkholderiaceae bacterium]|nr:methyl-accepting chemotaxis protein [Burkholderiaceae bacterium]